MAVNATVAKSKSFTSTSGSAVDKVTFTDLHLGVEVTWEGSADAYATVDGATDPTIGGDNTTLLPAGTVKKIRFPAPGPNQQIRIITTVAATLQVQGFDA